MKSYLQANPKFMLESLSNRSKEHTRENENQGNSSAQERGEILRTRQELAFQYGRQTSGLKTQLSEEEKMESDSKQQLQAARDISLGKEKQYREMQTLREELKKAGAQTAKATPGPSREKRSLQGKAFLEKGLSEPAWAEKEGPGLGGGSRGMLLSCVETSAQGARDHTTGCCSSSSSAWRCRPPKATYKVRSRSCSRNSGARSA